MSDQVTLTIDDKEVTVSKGTVVADAGKQVDVDIPVFCHHPKLQPVGMCRMCLVEIGMPDRNDPSKINYRMMTGCTVEVAPGMVVRTTTPVVNSAREDVIEFLLTSHPLDCPICDKGGECPLQNLTMAHGKGTSRFDFMEKMKQEKHVPLGELIWLDRERCIQCARCTRFQSEIVDDPVIAFHNRGRRLEIVTLSEPGFDSYWSGNTTDICPVGALTTEDFRFGARPWELTTSASICPHCPVGCNTAFSTRREAKAGGKEVIKRVLPRQNEQVNEVWICDKGRFVHHFSADEERLATPLIRKNGALQPASWDEALSLVENKLKSQQSSVAGLASGRLSNEDLFAFARLFKDGLKSEWFDLADKRLAGGDVVAQVGISSGSNLLDLGAGDAILVVATDLHEEAPVWWLRVKQAVKRGAKLVLLNLRATRLSPFATYELSYGVGGTLHMVRDLMNHAKLTDVPAQTNIEQAAQALISANNLTIFYGSEGLDYEQTDSLARLLGNLLLLQDGEMKRAGKRNNGLIPVWSKANTQGAWDMGVAGTEKADLLAGIQDGTIKALYLAGTDPIGDGLLTGRDGLEFLVVQELFLTETAKNADLVLPAQSWAEREGTYTNGERRVQRFYPAVPAVGESRADWQIFSQIGEKLGLGKPKFAASLLFKQIAQAVPAYAGMDYRALAQVTPQIPVVGSDDLYYGGASYANNAGLGVQWQAAAEIGEVAHFTLPELAPPSDQIQMIPIKALYQSGTLIDKSAVMAPRIAQPVVWVNPMDTDKLPATENGTIGLQVNGEYLPAMLRINEDVSAGVIVVRGVGVDAGNIAIAPATKPTPTGKGMSLLELFLRGLIVGVIMMFVVITGFAYTTLLERKFLARLQHRYGPNRAGYIPIKFRGKERRLLSGFMQPAADAVKLFFKEDFTPAKVEPFIYNLAPSLAAMTAIVILAVIPWAGKINILGAQFDPYFAIAPGINVGVLFIMAITSISVYSVVLAGWASNNKYAILGGIRASAQMISYELALGLSVLPPIILAGSMDLGVIVEKQSIYNGGVWYILLLPVAAIIFYIGILAELQRAPFDLLEAEQELSTGYSVEYSGMRFGMFFMAEYMKMISLSAIFATLFLGGYRGPFVDQMPALGFLYLLGKIILSLCLMIWIRASMPRLRYDQLMSFGWKVLLPLSVLNLIVTIVAVVLKAEFG